MFRCVALAACLLTSAAQAAPSILAPPTAPGAATLPYVKTKAPVIVLRHVRIIDGTGAAAQEDRTVILKDGRIAAVGDASLAVPTRQRFMTSTATRSCRASSACTTTCSMSPRPTLVRTGTASRHCWCHR